MDRLIAAYLTALVKDAAHAFAGKYTHQFPQSYCAQALQLLQTGQAGSDRFVDASAKVTGVEPAFVYQMLLGQARVEAATLGKRVTETRPKAA